MAPYVPFIVEAFYQNMRKVIRPESKQLQDSIHFLHIPGFNEQLVDKTLVNVMNKMQNIIQSARGIRDIHKLPVKQAVVGLKIVFKDEQALADLKLVESYILAECNVTKIEYTTEWRNYMKYKLIPNHKLLGEKYQDKYEDIRKRLMNLSDEEVELFFQNNKLEINGETYNEEALIPRAEFFKPKEQNVDIGGQLDYAVLLDMTITEDLTEQRAARDLVGRIQKIRQKEKLDVNSKIIITFDFVNKDSALAKAVRNKLNIVKETLLKYAEEYDSKTHYNLICDTEAEVDGEVFKIRISNNVLLPIHENISKDFSEAENTHILTFLGLVEPNRQAEVTVNFNDKEIKLVSGTHYRFAY